MSKEELTVKERTALERLLREAGEFPPLEQESHPSPWEIACYVERELDEETAGHVRVHLLHCEDCFEEVLGLEASCEGERFWEGLVAYVRSLAETIAAQAQPVPVYEAEGEAESEKEPRHIRAQVEEADARRTLELAVRYGPTISQEGTFYLRLQLPQGEQFEDRPVTIRLNLGQKPVEWEEEVRGDVIGVAHPFGSGPKETVQEELLEAALLKALEITIHGEKF